MSYNFFRRAFPVVLSCVVFFSSAPGAPRDLEPNRFMLHSVRPHATEGTGGSGLQLLFSFSQLQCGRPLPVRGAARVSPEHFGRPPAPALFGSLRYDSRMLPPPSETDETIISDFPTPMPYFFSFVRFQLPPNWFLDRSAPLELEPQDEARISFVLGFGLRAFFFL